MERSAHGEWVRADELDAALSAQGAQIERLTLERDSAREQFDRHVEWAAQGAAPEPQACARCDGLSDEHYCETFYAAIEHLKATGAQGWQPIATALEAEIERGLNTLDRECYGVDVREKHNVTNPVIATVVDRSVAMHALLFVRKVLHECVPPTGETP